MVKQTDGQKDVHRNIRIEINRYKCEKSPKVCNQCSNIKKEESTTFTKKKHLNMAIARENQKVEEYKKKNKQINKQRM